MFDKIKLLVEHGADVNAADESGNTPLSLAAAAGDIRIVQYLLDKGAKSKVGTVSPLAAAAAAGHLDCVKFLIEQGVPVNIEYHGYTALQVANTRKHKEVADYLKSKGATTNDENAFRALEEAIRNNNFAEVKKLIEEERVNINKPVDDLPLLAQAWLYSASAEKRKDPLEIFSYLIHSGINVNSKSKRSGPVLYYIMCDVVGGLANLEAAYSSESVVPQEDKKRFQDITIRAFQLLLKAGADVDAKNDSKDGNGRTPLHVAAAPSNFPIEMLLKAGAKVNEKDNIGQTPLHVACTAGNFPAIKALVNAGADINIKDKEGRTPMETICQGLDNVRLSSKGKEQAEQLRRQIQDYFKNLNKT
jgi:ankyrin repeat protein